MQSIRQSNNQSISRSGILCARSLIYVVERWWVSWFKEDVPFISSTISFHSNTHQKYKRSEQLWWCRQLFVTYSWTLVYKDLIGNSGCSWGRELPTEKPYYSSSPQTKHEKRRDDGDSKTSHTWWLGTLVAFETSNPRYTCKSTCDKVPRISVVTFRLPVD